MGDVGADFSRYRFLVVDDSAQVRQIVAAMLKRCHAKDILQAGSGSEALGLLANNLYEIDCVLCDWNMEPVDGLSLLAAVRTGGISKVPRDARVVMLTGHSEFEVVRAAIALDATAFIVKPVSMETLVKTLSAALARKIDLKPEAHYLSLPPVDLPDTLRRNQHATPNWAEMPSGPKARGTLAERLEELRQESLASISTYGRLPVSPQARTRCALPSIVPEAVLAEDIFDGDGLILVPTGTTLSQAILRLLRDIAGGEVEGMLLWVVQKT